jgi:hypothetical protein
VDNLPLALDSVRNFVYNGYRRPKTKRKDKVMEYERQVFTSGLMSKNELEYLLSKLFAAYEHNVDKTTVEYLQELYA